MGKFKVGERYVVGGNPKPLEGFVEPEIGNVIEITGVGKNHISCRTVRGESEGCVFAYDSPFAESLVPYKKLHKILITTDGKTTLARLYEDNKVVKRAEAKCSPDDEFDFLIGAKLAFERLTNDDSRERRLELAREICCMGWCSASNTRDRNKDCPFLSIVIKSSSDCFSYALDHPETLKMMEEYIAAEEKAKAAKVTVCKDYQPEPEYYSGKVVCVKSDCSWWTVGKVYPINDGVIKDDEGDVRDAIKSIEELNERLAGCDEARFIPLVE
jgi:hypothetical protein